MLEFGYPHTLKTGQFALDINIQLERGSSSVGFAYVGYPLELCLEGTEATNYKKYENYTQVIHRHCHLLPVSSPSSDQA